MEEILTRLEGYNVMVDDKIDEVVDSVESLVKLYADMEPCAPKFLTISGGVTSASLRRAVMRRGPIEIIMTTVLSDATAEDCFNDAAQLPQDRLWHRVQKGLSAEVQGITCPGHLLPHLKNYGGHVLATGSRSNGMPAQNHIQPKTLEEALAEGATHIIVGREVTEAANPVEALLLLGERAQKYKA